MNNTRLYSATAFSDILMEYIESGANILSEKIDEYKLVVEEMRQITDLGYYFDENGEYHEFSAEAQEGWRTAIELFDILT